MMISDKYNTQSISFVNGQIHSKICDCNNFAIFIWNLTTENPFNNGFISHMKMWSKVDFFVRPPTIRQVLSGFVELATQLNGKRSKCSQQISISIVLNCCWLNDWMIFLDDSRAPFFYSSEHYNWIWNFGPIQISNHANVTALLELEEKLVQFGTKLTSFIELNFIQSVDILLGQPLFFASLVPWFWYHRWNENMSTQHDLEYRMVSRLRLIRSGFFGVINRNCVR